MPAPKGNQNALGNSGGGGVSLYEERFARMASRACEAGFTDVQVADLLGVSVRTVNNWKVEYVEFAASLKIGKRVADDRVEASLYHRAVGFECDETDIRVIEGRIVETTVRKHYPPDTAAAFIWLKNRAGWSDRQEHTGADGKDLIPEQLKPEDVAREIAFLLAQAANKKDSDGS